MKTRDFAVVEASPPYPCVGVVSTTGDERDAALEMHDTLLFERIAPPGLRVTFYVIDTGYLPPRAVDRQITWRRDDGLPWLTVYVDKRHD